MHINWINFKIKILNEKLNLYYQVAELAENLFEDDQIILVRDISFLLSLPMYVFIPLCFVRGIGFDIKKFNFKSRNILISIWISEFKNFCISFFNLIFYI